MAHRTKSEQRQWDAMLKLKDEGIKPMTFGKLKDVGEKGNASQLCTLYFPETVAVNVNAAPEVVEAPKFICELLLSLAKPLADNIAQRSKMDKIS